jgi:acyl transferase domain-containing protein
MKSQNVRVASPTRPSEHIHPAGNTSGAAGETPSLATVVAQAVPGTSLPLRARLLQLLMIPIGPLAMTVLAGGAFAKYAQFARRLPIPLSADDAARVTSVQVAEIARYLEQADPSMLEQVAVALSREPTAMATLGASVAASLAAIAVKLASAGLSRGVKPPPRPISNLG